MNWIKIIIATFFEVGWVIGLTHASSWWEWLFTMIAIFVSFYLLVDASKVLPVGSAYAVFVGLGTTWVTLFDFLFFGEPFNVMKIMLIVILLASVISLKLVTTNKGGEA
ncbi:DMT family transporter [Staphylococcus saprophyticus]|uniref:DMT family transporter n=1 Tax=Staphylococcus saprophyticus TaxID=29385 RepID=UPI0008529B53|nr:multidrug efflux SMR transporter [Staphylococcus saprophyticus]MDW3860682.1 multidrug efflux SMR transporter [Staphylococcus saprophyticus]MDW3985538.1 multidrug efflux SMR transporter [Staphylococcus saprophyticus]MDW4240948.1 multidrug efflux SMR transporter [Staphylococcus saprophyticus]OEK33422.1 multidrug resistance protein SMR [Staphylococcus saprophyticus]